MLGVHEDRVVSSLTRDYDKVVVTGFDQCSGLSVDAYHDQSVCEMFGVAGVCVKSGHLNGVIAWSALDFVDLRTCSVAEGDEGDDDQCREY